MKKIKIAQIGIGHNHGADKMQTLRALPDYFEVVGVAESDPYWYNERHGYGAYAGLPFLTEEEILAIPDLDAIAVETDGKYLISTALRCAERGLHLHMDKPGGEDFEGFRKLCRICQEKDLAFQAAYIYRYNPALKFCMEAVKNGWIGDIFEIHSVMSRDDSKNDAYRQWLSQFKGGAFNIFAEKCLPSISTITLPDANLSILTVKIKFELVSGLFELEDSLESFLMNNSWSASYHIGESLM